MNCIKISPVVEVGRMFNTKDDMTIWEYPAFAGLIFKICELCKSL